MAFSCAVILETGCVNMNTDKLQDLFVVSSGDSIYVWTNLIDDPRNYKSETSTTLSPIVGNIRRTGIILFIPPTGFPRVRPGLSVDLIVLSVMLLSIEKWKIISRERHNDTASVVYET